MLWENKDLTIQNNIFKFNGVIGRKYFIIGIIPLMIYNFCLECCVMLFREYALHDLDYKPLLIILLFLIPPYLYLKLGILTKRISDICGTRHNSFSKATFIYSLSIATKGLVGILAIIYLAIKKGKVTNNVLDNKIKNEKRIKIDDISKCPSCKADVKISSAYCNECGFNLRDELVGGANEMS